MGFKSRCWQPIGPCIVDFINLERRVIIELDGGQHALGEGLDRERDAWLKTQKFTVLRFWNNEVLGNIEGVLEAIRNALLAPSPDPSRAGEGRRECA